MAGLDPAIHVVASRGLWRWMLATGAGVTRFKPSSRAPLGARRSIGLLDCFVATRLAMTVVAENTKVLPQVTGAISTHAFSSELRAQASASWTSRMPAASVWLNGASATTWGMKPSQPKR